MPERNICYILVNAIGSNNHTHTAFRLEYLLMVECHVGLCPVCWIFKAYTG